MSEKKPINPPAFACAATAGLTQTGMTLRDYFAKGAMEAIIISPGILISNRNKLAQDAYEVAEAMLKEREKYDKESPTT